MYEKKERRELGNISKGKDYVGAALYGSTSNVGLELGHPGGGRESRGGRISGKSQRGLELVNT